MGKDSLFILPYLHILYYFILHWVYDYKRTIDHQIKEWNPAQHSFWSTLYELIIE